jgi:hypothetical protein
MRKAIITAALLLSTQAHAQSIPVESDAIMSKNAPLALIDPAVGLIRANGWRCDSVSSLVPFVMSRGFTIVCNRFAYKYELEDRGGRWVATLK